MARFPTLLRALVRSEEVVYVMTADRAILRTNPAWERFACANGGASMLDRWGRGKRIDGALPEPLRAFYVGAFERALASGERWEHDYECSSDETYRRFRMVVYPFGGRFLAVVNSLLVETPMDREAFDPRESTYAVEGLVTMCSHCRRVRYPGDTGRWDWVPAYVRAPPDNLTHGLCGPCVAFYFGDDAAGD